MSAFRLAGLQRVRDIEKDKAMGRLGAATQAAAARVNSAASARAVLAGVTATNLADPVAWAIGAVGRGAASRLVAEREAQVVEANAVVRERQAEANLAAQRLRVVEKLHGRFDRIASAAAAKSELAVLDEVATQRAARSTGAAERESA